MASLKLNVEDVQPSPAKKLKIERDDDYVEFSNEDYTDCVYINDFDDDDPDMLEQCKLFDLQFEGSEGFDVNFRELRYKFLLQPVSWKERGLSVAWRELTDGELVKKLTVFAFDEHNLHMGTKLKLVKLLKANWHPCKGFNFYVTCLVKDMMDDGKLKTYQVEVQNFVEEIIVHKVREKPACKDPSIDAVNR